MRPQRYNVIILPLAELDLSAIHDRLALEWPELADWLQDRIATAILSLNRFALRHPVSRERRLARRGVRSFVVLSYRVYYFVVRQDVLVLRVWHSARRTPGRPLI